MENLKILALGRNQIKKIENLDSVAETLEELWISYNVLERLVHLNTYDAHSCGYQLFAKICSRSSIRCQYSVLQTIPLASQCLCQQ